MVDEKGTKTEKAPNVEGEIEAPEQTAEQPLPVHTLSIVSDGRRWSMTFDPPEMSWFESEALLRSAHAAITNLIATGGRRRSEPAQA